MESNTRNSESKRTPQPLETLSKEELLQKCRTLLSIAQRAKAAKDDALKESQSLKDEIDVLKNSKTQDVASAEMIEALTTQKLQLTIELDESKRLSRNFKSEFEELQAKTADQENQIESLRRQLARSSSDCNALEAQLERLDAENRRLAAVANEAEAELRRGAVERQDALEGLGDELANVKNAAAEALAERDRLKAQLQQQSPNSNFQILESCQLVVQELRSSQTLLRSDIAELQNTASVMAVDLGAALSEAQSATEAAARHSSKDILAEMNEAMKTRGEVAAQLAEKLSTVERERDMLSEAKVADAVKINSLDKNCEILQTKLKEWEDEVNLLKQENENKISELSDLRIENESNKTKLLQFDVKLDEILSQKSIIEMQCGDLQNKLQLNEQEAQILNSKLVDSETQICSLKAKSEELKSVSKENEGLKTRIQGREKEIESASELIRELKEKTCEMNKTQEVQLKEKLEELQSVITENEGLKTRIDGLKKELESSSELIRELQEKTDDTNKTLTKEVQLKEKLEEIESVVKENDVLKTRIEELEGELSESLRELQEKTDEINVMGKSSTLENQFKEKLDELENVVKTNEGLQIRIQELEGELISSSELARKLHEKTDEINVVVNENENLKQEVQVLKTITENKIQDSNRHDSEVEAEKQALTMKLCDLEKENAELVQSLDIVNEKLQHLESTLKDSEGMKQSISDYECSVDEFRTRISVLEKELATVKCSETDLHNLQEENSKLREDTQKLIEALSTIESQKLEIATYLKINEEKLSIQSKMEEMLEKDKELLVCNHDLQKKVTQVSESEANLKKELENVCNKNKELLDLTSNLKEKLSEFEREREDCEGASVSTVSRTEDSARLRDVEESFEERYTKLRAVAVKLKQKCHDQAGVLTKVLAERTELQSKLSTCCKDRDTLAKNIQSMQAACDASTDDAEAARIKAAECLKDLKRAGEELSTARNNHAQAVEKIAHLEAKLQQALSDRDAAKLESKKSSMLNLEMAAYEKSAAEQDRKIAQFKVEVDSLKAELECQKGVSSTATKEVKMLQEKNKDLISENSTQKEQIVQIKIQLNELQDQLLLENRKLSEAKSKYELKQSDLERVELQLAELTAEKVQSDEAAKTFRQQAARQIHVLEEQLNSTSAAVTAKEEELNNLQSDFEGYKVRAQAVLQRQQKQPASKEDANKEAELVSELSLLKSTVERLQTSLCDAGSREKSLQAEISVLVGQNTALQASARNMASQVSELTNKSEELKNKILKSEESIRDTTRQHRLALDTLASSYKQQLSDAEKRHKLQLASMQATHDEVAQQSHFSSVEHDQHPVLQQREEGEGSENVDSPKASIIADSRREPLPLDRLLSSSSDYHDDVKSEISFDAASVSSVLAAEKRAKHLAALLGEAEADLARLSQQNSVLKEEIRRQQRCMERQQHTLSNGEYLKNVVLKFITLQGGDERARLVPVLNTILKLSPEETEQLQVVATGAPSASPGAANASSGWGSYLHLWSGTH